MGTTTIASLIRKIESLSAVHRDTAFGVAHETPSIVDPADCSVATDALFSSCFICSIKYA
jgi:hypothetical protein